MKNMEVWSLFHTSLFATFIHINATSMQLFPTANMHGFFDLPLPYTAIGVIKYIVRWTKKSKIKKPFW